MFRWVVFDLGGVLVEFAGFVNLPDMVAGDLTVDEARRRWIASPAVAAFERGGLTSEQFAEELAREWNLTVPPDVFLEHFVAWAKDFFPGARDLVTETRAVAKVACFSNTNPLHWHKNFTAYGIPQSFDRSLASFELGVVKPTPEAFARIVTELACAPSEILFLDDTEVNVEGATQAGLAAVLVRGVEGARAALVDRGVLSSA